MGYFNPVNYAAGLLEELDGAHRAGRDELAEQVRAELELVAPAAAAMDVSGLDDDQKAFVARVNARTGAVLAEKAHETAEAKSEEFAPAASGKRTAKAAAPPRTAG